MLTHVAHQRQATKKRNGRGHDGSTLAAKEPVWTLCAHACHAKQTRGLPLWNNSPSASCGSATVPSGYCPTWHVGTFVSTPHINHCKKASQHCTPLPQLSTLAQLLFYDSGTISQLTLSVMICRGTWTSRLWGFVLSASTPQAMRAETEAAAKEVCIGKGACARSDNHHCRP